MCTYVLNCISIGVVVHNQFFFFAKSNRQLFTFESLEEKIKAIKRPSIIRAIMMMY